MSKFYLYWIICIVAAIWSAFEKLLAPLQHRSMIYFWIGIVVASFFWLSAVGERIKDKAKADSNPF